MTAIALQNLFTVTEVELVYRNKLDPADRPQINCSSHAYNILMASWDMNKIELVEHFKIILLNRRNACLGVSEISTGGMSECLVDLKIVFATALKAGACQLILAHNHPSGSLQPSAADIALTNKMREAGKLLSIQVSDHLIVTPRGYFSFADDGLMF